MQKQYLSLVIVGLLLSPLSFASTADLSSTRWSCTTNAEKNNANSTTEAGNPATKRLINTATKGKAPDGSPLSGEKLANDSLANAFATAVQDCGDCTDIHCVMQK
ncbi:MAG: hypothetical protein H0U57_05500 [Tatlockia sp.]|nr:hypothetical protein [Tatlockia sp.]